MSYLVHFLGVASPAYQSANLLFYVMTMLSLISSANDSVNHGVNGHRSVTSTPNFSINNGRRRFPLAQSSKDNRGAELNLSDLGASVS